MEQLLEQVSFADVSPYLVIALLVFLYTRKDVAAAIGNWFRRKTTVDADEREHRQLLEQERFEVAVQNQIAADMRKWQTENQALELLRENINWSREDFSKMQQRLDQILFAINRANDLSTIQSQAIAELADNLRKLGKHPNETQIIQPVQKIDNADGD